MSTEKKKDATGLMVTRTEIGETILGKLQDAVSAWEANRTEDLSALVNKLMDLGVAWEQFQVFGETDNMIMQPGVGQLLTEESDIGKLISDLKVAVETRNIESFKESVQGVTNMFAAQEVAAESDGATPTPEEGVVPEGEELNPEGEQDAEVEVAQAEEDTSVEAPEEQNLFDERPMWGEDLAAEHTEQVAEQQKLKAATERQERLTKAASIKPNIFSWDNVEKGELIK